MTLFDLPDDPATTDPATTRSATSPSATTPSAADLRDPVRVRLVVAYDGTGYHGFAANAGVRTVGGTLAQAAQVVLGHPLDLTCAGRTDKGVHARAQVVTFDTDRQGLDLPALQKSLNSLCAPGIAVTAAEEVPGDFDARFSAISRRYRYTVLNRPAPDPFRARYAWHVDEELSWPAMVLACDALIGEHDFSAFCRRPKRGDGVEVSLVRRVIEAGWERGDDHELRFEIEASSFCHQMVRSVVGLLVDVGRGRRRAGDVLGVIASRDRGRAANLAPPQGLSLWTVRYPGWSSGS